MNPIGSYLLKQNFSPVISSPPSDALTIIVVIPCRAEPDLDKTIFSLQRASADFNHLMEIVVVINDLEGDGDEVIAQNYKTKEWLSSGTFEIPVYSLQLGKMPHKKGGVGYARKKGMDEAVYRFDLIGQKNGIICSMDADTMVAENYFAEVINAFDKQKKECLVIHFEHPLNGLDSDHRLAIVNYELHLRYYIEALRWSGFSHAYQTLGSAIAVSATGYAVMGGMPVRQAGEDFYFVHKFSKLNQVFELNTTTVYPSSRVSDRVPFGTGKAIGDLMKNKIKWGITYPIQAFKDLRVFLDYSLLLNDTSLDVTDMPASINAFLAEIDFKSILDEIKSNTSSRENFKKRFYQKMDAFMMMKYIHFARDHFYGNVNIFSSAMELFALQYRYTPLCSNPEELLILYREMQKKSNR